MLARRELFERERGEEGVLDLGLVDGHVIREVAALMGSWLRELERREDVRWRDAPAESRVDAISIPKGRISTDKLV